MHLFALFNFMHWSAQLSVCSVGHGNSAGKIKQPDRLFHNSRTSKDSIEFSKVHKIRRSTDLRALKLWKGRSGRKPMQLDQTVVSHLMGNKTNADYPECKVVEVVVVVKPLSHQGSSAIQKTIQSLLVLIQQAGWLITRNLTS